jgi:hypothetical protein
MRLEISLHLEAGYIFADCFSSDPILHSGGGAYIIQQLSP